MKDATENTTAGATERYERGWRAGKPVEDPEKMKRWGFISARPSEYLITTRRGQIDPRRSGQGARIFKWPWESIAVVPTSLQQIDFAADQITRERVGVRVSGVAVYRIARPELAFRVLNFTYAERASEKLARTMVEMFVGAARRLIANLTLEECLQKRKEAIAEFLMTEIAPVLGGKGAAEDDADQGWGVVIDTIEIQDVKILSQAVFQHLQAPYRAEIAARAELAELERQRAVAEQRAEVERRAAEAALRSQQETRVLRARIEAEAAAVEVAQQQRAALQRAQAEEAAIQQAAALDMQRHQARVQQIEQERQQAAARQEAELAQRALRERQELALRLQEAEARQREGELMAAQQLRSAEIEQMLAQVRATQDLVKALPQIAAALRQSMGTVNYTHVGGGDGGPVGMLTGGLAQLLALLRQAGVSLPGEPRGPAA
jgi:uncharacterized membrane protein YqiK